MNVDILYTTMMDTFPLSITCSCTCHRHTDTGSSVLHDHSVGAFSKPVIPTDEMVGQGTLWKCCR